MKSEIDIPELQVAGDIELKNVKFPTNQQGYVIVFIDCSRNCAVFFDFCHKLNAYESTDELATLYAINISVKFGILKLCIGTKSKFILEKFRAWIYNKNRNAYEFGQQVGRYAKFIELDKLLEDIEIKWVDAEGLVFPWMSNNALLKRMGET